MKNKIHKSLNVILSLIMILSITFIIGMPMIVEAEEQVFVETFDNFPETSERYSSGSFVGVNDITWNYEGARGDLDAYEIDGRGIMFRRPGDGAKIYANIEGGISSFSIDTKKAFTGSGRREIELLINDESKATFLLDNSNDGVQTFEINNINISGNFKLEIRHIGTKDGSQIVIDNITWTSYTGHSDNKVHNVTATPKEGRVSKGTEIILETRTEGATIYYTLDSSDPDTNSTVYTGPIVINQTTTIKAIAVKEDMEDSDISEFTYTVFESTPINEIRKLGDDIEVMAEGIITADFGDTIYIQDDTGGIAIYKRGFNKGSLKLGDKVEVRGRTRTYYGLKEIVLDSDNDIKFLENSEVPEAKVLKSKEITNDVQGQLVKIENIFVESVDRHRIFTLRDDSEGATFAREFESRLIEVGNSYASITGIVVYEYDQVRLLTRFPEDIVEDKTIVKPVQANPSGGKVVAGSKVELSTKTEGAIIYYTTDGSEPTIESNKYTSPIIINEPIILKAIAVKEGLKNSIVATFEYEIADIEQGVKISDIQGAGHRSPLENERVIDVTGIVTGIFVDTWNDGFFIQEINPDDDQIKSKGIFINRKANGINTSVNVGDMVIVSGVVKEDKFENVYDNTLTVTQIHADEISVLSSNNSLPNPVLIGRNGRQVPDKIHDGNWEIFAPETKALDFYESLEGMLVEVEEPLIVGVREDYGEIIVLPDEGECCADRLSNNNGILLLPGHHNPQRVLISDKILPITKDKKFDDPNFRVKVGDKFDGTVVGIMSYDFGNYKLYNTERLPNIIDGGLRRDTTKIAPHDEKLSMAVYNVENFSAKSTDRLDGLVRDIIENMKSPDIIGLVEIQDNDGEGGKAGSDATETLSMIIEGIKKNGGPEYGFVNINPENNKDGGAPNANIRPAFIYRKDRVSIVEAEPGDATTPVGLEGEGKNTTLTLNPGRIDPNNLGFEDSRKPIIAEFKFGDEKIFVINNHFASKRGDTPLFGAIQPPANGSEENRHKQARIVNDFVKDIMARNPDANIVVMGDLNDFQFSETLRVLKGEEMINAIDLLPIEEQHTYVHEGNSQVLDHILVSKNLEGKIEVDIININAEFIEAHGRISDHDPVMIQIDFSNEGAETPIGNELKIEKPKMESFNYGNIAEIKIKVKNGTTKSQDIILIAGVYEKDTNRLIGQLKTISKTVSAKTIETIATNIKVPKVGNYVVKYFIWDNLENMKPLTDNEIVPVQ
ncbi:chitobiase/beta-hexosaminidase C-terminal domain-containing protein [Tepidimicrobium xylanilyticum]|uniref:chitobiase/beta-hexosaminidase C-terminal domain-containing protein n=1 Tax=Tepidimicrobium xylanilyticum TaxID=1123352 RepID=UPI002651DFB6|nr:chitobiase/beta-hexosaminidase C-terminal domain-containing protein [Tepidimicrobium xylanilyticum]GMG96643.1 hypothetical protein EN5CB1_14690 [Tepidimicrobium xylanilyticum]